MIDHIERHQRLCRTLDSIRDYNNRADEWTAQVNATKNRLKIYFQDKPMAKLGHCDITISYPMGILISFCYDGNYLDYRFPVSLTEKPPSSITYESDELYKENISEFRALKLLFCLRNREIKHQEIIEDLEAPYDFIGGRIQSIEDEEIEDMFDSPQRDSSYERTIGSGAGLTVYGTDLNVSFPAISSHTIRVYSNEISWEPMISRDDETTDLTI